MVNRQGIKLWLMCNFFDVMGENEAVASFQLIIGGSNISNFYCDV